MIPISKICRASAVPPDEKKGSEMPVLGMELVTTAILRMVCNAPDKFCALTVWGLTFKIALQVAMNIAVVTNSMPNTGISLPFFSSGGTSLMIQIFEIAIILSISRYSREKKE